MIDLKTYGYTGVEAIPDGLLPGKVTELRRERFTVMTERGEVTAVLKGAFYRSVETHVDFPCVGDFVLLYYNESGDSHIVKVLPRRSKFSRADYSGHAAGYAKTVLEQVVATNFDYVFILSSLNKVDLVEDYNLPLTAITQSISDVPVHAICSHTRLGLNELAPYLMPGKTVVFLGMSGVGKSSLLNALIEQDVMKVQAIREVDSRGRHTTTHRQLFLLPSGSMVIDTPGMRELGLFDADQGIRVSFTDVEEWFHQCRFTDCRHQAEPGCAVLAALADGSLPRERWAHYVVQQHENKYVQDKTSSVIDKRDRNKTNTTWSKQKKKNGGMKK